MKYNTRFLIVYVLLILAGLFINLHSDVEVPLNRPFEEFPTEHNGWHMVSESHFSADILDVLNPTDYLLRKYEGPDGIPVSIYIGYHSGGKDAGPIHSPKHCLPGGGWYPISEEKLTINSSYKEIAFVKSIYQKGAYRQLFLYWFAVKGRAITNEFALKLEEIKNSIFYRRRDSSFIRISVDIKSDENESFLAGKKFIKDFYPVLIEFLPE